MILTALIQHSNQLALIDLPNDFVSGITANATELIGDFSPYIYLVLGVLLLTAVVGTFISHLKG
jgi:hypothetical protein